MDNVGNGNSSVTYSEDGESKKNRVNINGDKYALLNALL